MNNTSVRTRALYHLADVRNALDRSKGRLPDLEVFYERMLDIGSEGVVTTMPSTTALAALYQLLEPETSRAFRDDYIDVKIDVSQIFWILTANSTDGISAPLLNRMVVYEVSAPTP